MFGTGEPCEAASNAASKAETLTETKNARHELKILDHNIKNGSEKFLRHYYLTLWKLLR